MSPALQNAPAVLDISVLGDATGVARTTTYTSTSKDLQGFEGVIDIVQQVGTVGGTSPTLDGKIQDSADNSSFADVTGATFATQVTATGNTQTLRLGVNNLRRYIKYVGTIGGTSPSFVITVPVVGVKKVQ